MKTPGALLLVALAFFTGGARAQGLAPESVAGLSALVIITNGTGYFAPVGAGRLILDRTGTVFALTPLNPNLAASAGTYSYVRTGPSTAQMTLRDVAMPVPITYSMVFTTQTSAAYGVSNALGVSTGYVILENGVLTPPATSRGLINLAVRAFVPAGGQVIPGFVLDAPTRVLVRVGGPVLTAFGVAGALPNPRVTVLTNDAPVATNDDWDAAPANGSAVRDAAAKTGAFAYAGNSRDAALVIDLPAGAHTCLVQGEPGTSGEVLLEVYRVP